MLSPPPFQPLLDDLSSDDEAGANSSGYTRRKSRRPNPTVVQQQAAAIGVDDGDAADGDDMDRIPKEPIKTLVRSKWRSRGRS